MPILNQVKSGSRHKSEFPGRLPPPSAFSVGTNHSLRRLPTEAGPGEGTRVPRRPVLLKLQSAAVQQSGLVLRYGHRSQRLSRHYFSTG